MKYALLIFFITAFRIPSHEIPIAFFEITLVDEYNVTIDIQLDKKDLESNLSVSSEEKIKQYLFDNTKWKLNKEVTPLEICSIQKDEEHYLLETQFPPLTKKLKFLEISNTCLINIPNQSNIIYLNYKDEKRGFRLHKNRQETSIEL